ncbi:hypothetical protein Tco_1255049 [Tanacetum coccineum]
MIMLKMVVVWTVDVLSGKIPRWLSSDCRILLEKTHRCRYSGVLELTKCQKVDAIAWWIDSGATTKDVRSFSVALEFSSGKIVTLFNVLYVPKLRFGYYNNGMFMLNLNKVPDDSDSVYMSSSTGVNSTLWHAQIESRDAIFDEDVSLQYHRPKGHNYLMCKESQWMDIPMYQYEISRALDERRILEPIMKLCNLVDVLFWKEAIDAEIGCKGSFKRRWKVDGTIDKFKALIGNHKDFDKKEGIDYCDICTVARI